VSCSTPAESAPDAAVDSGLDVAVDTGADLGVDATDTAPEASADADVDGGGSPLKATTLALGYDTSCALSAAGEVRCWGLWQNDDGTVGSNVTPTAIAISLTPVGLVAGSFHDCVWGTGNTMQCWGSNARGQLGVQPSLSARGSMTPRTIDLSKALKSVSLGPVFTCALHGDGSVYCFGESDLHQLGVDLPNCQQFAGAKKFACSPKPVLVDLPKAAVALSAGMPSVAWLSDGDLRAWGGSAGDLFSYLSGPTEPVTSIDALGPGTCFLRKGERWCWNPKTGSVAKDATYPTSLAEMVGDATFACVRTLSGDVLCRGDNTDGQLGDGTFTARTTFVKVAGLTAKTIRAGDRHVCAIDMSDEVWCWGHGADGELGTGKKDTQPSAQRVLTF